MWDWIVWNCSGFVWPNCTSCSDVICQRNDGGLDIVAWAEETDSRPFTTELLKNVNNELEINTHNSVGEPGSDIEGEEIVGEDDRDSISGKRIIGRCKGKAGRLDCVYRPKFIISGTWRKDWIKSGTQTWVMIMKVHGDTNEAENEVDGWDERWGKKR